MRRNFPAPGALAILQSYSHSTGLDQEIYLLCVLPSLVIARFELIQASKQAHGLQISVIGRFSLPLQLPHHVRHHVCHMAKRSRQVRVYNDLSADGNKYAFMDTV